MNENIVCTTFTSEAFIKHCDHLLLSYILLAVIKDHLLLADVETGSVIHYCVSCLQLLLFVIVYYVFMLLSAVRRIQLCCYAV